MAIQKKPRIALLAAPESSPLVLFGLYDVLSSVGVVYLDMTCGEPGESLLDVDIVAASAEPFRCFGNILVEPKAIAGIDISMSLSSATCTPPSVPRYTAVTVRRSTG